MIVSEMYVRYSVVLALQKKCYFRCTPESGGRCLAWSHIYDGEISTGALYHVGVSQTNREGVEMKQSVWSRNMLS